MSVEGKNENKQIGKINYYFFFKVNILRPSNDWILIANFKLV